MRPALILLLLLASWQASADAVSLGPATGVASSPSTCPDADGSASPSTGTPQYASVAALKASGTYAVQINTNLGCMVAGVDYHVGLSTAQTLLDPTTGSLPSGCSYSSGTKTVTCNGNNITYQGWDHTLNNSIAFYLTGNGNTVTQNKFGGAGSNCPNPPVRFVSIGGTTTFTYNTVIGSAGACGDQSFNGTIHGTVANGGTLLIEWNYIQNSSQDMIAIAGPSGGGNAVYTEKYNLKDLQGWFGHPDGIQFCAGNFNPITISHNTYRQNTTPTLAGGTQPLHVEAQCTAALSNTVVSYNTMVTPGTGGGQTANYDIACKLDAGSNTNATFSAYGNYIDASGAYAALLNGGCVSPTWGSPQANYRMDTGNACSGTTCN